MKDSTNKRGRRQPWKETRVSLAKATAHVFTGPGSDWLLVLRGQRTQPHPPVRRSARGGRL
jgi:hypothetical protein